MVLLTHVDDQSPCCLMLAQLARVQVMLDQRVSSHLARFRVMLAST
jgi:hypothetical protein